MATESPDLLARIDDLERSQREPLPRAFGPYLLVRSLAKGGMGEVFFARSGAVAGFEKHCVVKTLRPHLTDDREYVARFIDEARVVVQLNHKNVCQVFDVGLVGERYYLAMELIAGQDVRALADALLAKGTPFPPALALHIVTETLEALDYAHRKLDVEGQPLNLVHRDISPQNVMVSYEGEVKLIDFGLAASSVKVEKTSPNLVMGKLAYMSVEQIRGEAVDRGVDLFATAVMLTELLLGERFYVGLTAHETWSLAAQGHHRPPRYGTLDEDMRAILDRALHVDKTQRFADGFAFREALMKWRSARGLWADGPALRALMQETFSDSLLEHHLLLQDTARIMRAPVTSSQEPSRSLLRSGAVDLATALLEPIVTTPEPSLPPSSTLPIAATELTTTVTPSTSTTLSLSSPLSPRVVTEVTGAVVNAALGGRDRIVKSLAVAAGLGVLVVTAVLWMSRGAPATGADADGLDVVAVSTDAGDAADVVDAATVVVVDPIVVVDPATADETRTPLPKTAKAAKPPMTPTPTPTSTPTPTRAQWNDATPGEQAALLKRSCPKLACAVDLDRRRADWAKQDAFGMSRFRADLSACRKSCGRF